MACMIVYVNDQLLTQQEIDWVLSQGALVWSGATFWRRHDTGQWGYRVAGHNGPCEGVTLPGLAVGGPYKNDRTFNPYEHLYRGVYGYGSLYNPGATAAASAVGVAAATFGALAGFGGLAGPAMAVTKGIMTAKSSKRSQQQQQQTAAQQQHLQSLLQQQYQLAWAAQQQAFIHGAGRPTQLAPNGSAQPGAPQQQAQYAAQPAYNNATPNNYQQTATQVQQLIESVTGQTSAQDPAAQVQAMMDQAAPYQNAAAGAVDPSAVAGASSTEAACACMPGADAAACEALAASGAEAAVFDAFAASAGMQFLGGMQF